MRDGAEMVLVPEELKNPVTLVVSWVSVVEMYELVER